MSYTSLKSCEFGVIACDLNLTYSYMGCTWSVSSSISLELKLQVHPIWVYVKFRSQAITPNSQLFNEVYDIVTSLEDKNEGWQQKVN
jgi:hypothetical protein